MPRKESRSKSRRKEQKKRRDNMKKQQKKRKDDRKKREEKRKDNKKKKDEKKKDDKKKRDKKNKDNKRKSNHRSGGSSLFKSRRNYGGKMFISSTPSSNQTQDVFSWNGNDFITDNFNPEKFNYLINQEQLQDIFSQLKSSKYYHASPGSDCSNMVPCCIIFIFFILALVLYIFWISTQDEFSFLFVLIPLGIIIGLIILIFCMIDCCDKRTTSKLNKMKEKESDFLNILRPVNERYKFQKIEFSVGRFGMWIILRKIVGDQEIRQGNGFGEAVPNMGNVGYSEQIGAPVMPFQPVGGVGNSGLPPIQNVNVDYAKSGMDYPENL